MSAPSSSSASASPRRQTAAAAAEEEVSRGASSGSDPRCGFFKTDSGRFLEEDPLGIGVPMPVVTPFAAGSAVVGAKGVGPQPEPEPSQAKELALKATTTRTSTSTSTSTSSAGSQGNDHGEPTKTKSNPDPEVVEAPAEPQTTRDEPTRNVRLESLPGSFAIRGPGAQEDSESSESEGDFGEEDNKSSSFLVPEAFLVTEHQQRQEEIENDNIIHAEAAPMKDPVPNTTATTTCPRLVLLAFAAMALLLIGLISGMVILFTKSSPDVITNTVSPDDTQFNVTRTQDQGAEFLNKSILQRVLERGYLRCGTGSQLRDIFSTIIKPGNQSRVPADQYETSVLPYYCQALSAAIFNGTASYEVVFAEPDEITQMLANHTLDAVVSRKYINMADDIYEEQAKNGLAYCQPYLSGGTGFTGIPHFVNCSDNNLKTHDECSDFKVCINTKFKIAEEILQNIPGGMVVQATDSATIVQNFFQGKCNVIATESAETMKLILEARGYPGVLTMGKKLYDIFRFSLYSLDDDPEWSDMINAVTLALLIAERDGITKDTADRMPSAGDWWGKDFQHLLVNAVRELGNFGEFYKLPIARTSVWNDGSQGLLASPPLGAVESTTGKPPDANGSLAAVLERGFLNCGVRGDRPGFAHYNQSTKTWEGMDVSYCFAVASSLFGGTGTDAQYHDVSESNGLVALQSGVIDVLVGETWTIEKDMKEAETKVGFTFTAPYFYGPVDDSSFEENLCLVTRQDDRQWSDFVNWVSLSIVYAEKHGISQINSNSMPIVNLYGRSLQRMLRDAIYAVGNYGELYDQHLSRILPRGGRNQLEVDAPTHYYPPWK